MHAHRLLPGVLGLLAAMVPIRPAAAQVPATIPPGTPLAATANRVAQAVGPQSLSGLAFLEGSLGSPQPAEWSFHVADPSVRGGLRLVTANSSTATDRGPALAGYPANIPPAFFAWSDVQLDNLAAFRTAESEARQALVAFDAVHYRLQATEQGKPVWMLTLRDVEGRTVGCVHLSARTGEVSRRIWFRYGAPGRQSPLRIEDSACPVPGMQIVPTALPPVPADPGPATDPAPAPIALPGP